jgi:hypothetical protein
MLLLWPAIYNGQPLFSNDTTAYIRGFDAGVVWLSGRTSAWTTWASQLPAQAAGQEYSAAGDYSLAPTGDTTVGETTSFQSSSFIVAGRSVSYGALLYLGELLGGLWASVVVQAAAALVAVALTLRHLELFTWPDFGDEGEAARRAQVALDDLHRIELGQILHVEGASDAQGMVRPRFRRSVSQMHSGLRTRCAR